MNLATANIWKLNYLASKGFDPRHHNARFWLEVAMDAERIKKELGPFDPAFQHYAERERIAFDAALMAEEIGNG